MKIWIIITAFVLLDLAFALFIVRFVIRGQWRSLAEKYPPVPPAPDAVSRRRQSFKVGLLNLGWCVHTTVDEGHLHLALPRFFEWLGVTPVSVPWSDVELIESRWTNSWRSARIGQQTLHGPAWCLDLADPEPNDSETDPAHPV